MSSRVPAPQNPDRHPWAVNPLYNEACLFAGVSSGLLTAFEHVVCVDDGSTDGSAAIARDAGAHLVEHPVNLGQGAALQTGITFALSHDECHYIVTFDADGQHRLTDALGMLDLARTDDLAIVFG